jgi:uncharacterized Ntn-hydrolase superfamily protein
VTFSIVGFDRESGDLGIAVASKFPAAGSAVPWARAGVGAIATQASANTTYGPRGLSLLEGGMDAASALDALVATDDGRDERQVGVVDARGGVATFTGSRCFDWAGGATGDGFAAQGNILAGEGVVRAMAEAYASGTGDLVDRLLAALAAGDGAGGDRRGRQSAALLVVREGGGYEGFNDRYVDLRVDDHPQAPVELARLFTVWDDTMLVRDDVAVEATPARMRAAQDALRRLGYLDAEPADVDDDATRQALEAWAGWENLELRIRDDGLLSERLLEELAQRAGDPELSP